MIIITEYIKQYIVVRKDVRTVTGRPVSTQKLAVMVAHASMAFLSNLVLGHDDKNTFFFSYGGNIVSEGFTTSIKGSLITSFIECAKRGLYPPIECKPN